jgi:hypothetical protein
MTSISKYKGKAQESEKKVVSLPKILGIANPNDMLIIDTEWLKRKLVF